jgi:hypothetical protein
MQNTTFPAFKMTSFQFRLYWRLKAAGFGAQQSYDHVLGRLNFGWLGQCIRDQFLKEEQMIRLTGR